MSVLHAKFDVKTVINEEVPVNEWQKKIKSVKVGRNDVYSINSKILVKTEVFSIHVIMVHPAHRVHWKGSRNQL